THRHSLHRYRVRSRESQGPVLDRTRAQTDRARASRVPRRADSSSQTSSSGLRIKAHRLIDCAGPAWSSRISRPSSLTEKRAIMAKTVADQFAQILIAAGVKRIYGIVGDSLNGLTDAVRRHGKIEWVHVRHEEVAAFAAGAEAHLTGELAVCAGSCGPGNLHLINGLFDCQRSRVPVLAIAAHIPSAEIGGCYFQETHPEQLFAECAHYVELVSNPDQMPRILEKAIRIAVARRGVSVVVIPGDVALLATDAKVASWLAPRPPVVRPSDADLDALAKLLNNGERITMMCGAGCAGAHAQIV